MTVSQEDTALEEAKVLLATARWVFVQEEEDHMAGLVDTEGVWFFEDWNVYKRSAYERQECRSIMADEDGLFSNTATPWISTAPLLSVLRGHHFMAAACRFMARAEARLFILGGYRDSWRLQQLGANLFGPARYWNEWEEAKTTLAYDLHHSGRGGRQ